MASQKFSQENLDTLKNDKNTKLEILKDIFTDIDFPDYANEEWYSALAHQKSVAELEYYWEGILPDYPNVAKTLASNHHINKKLLSDVRNFGKKLEKIEETKNIGYAIEDLVFANPTFIELRFEIFPDGKDFFEEFYEPEKRRNTYFPLFLKNPGLPEDILEILELKYNYESARDHINYSEKLIIKTLQNKDLSITDKFSFIYSDKCSEKILDALLNSEKNSNNKSNFLSSGRLRKAIALHEKTSSYTVNNLLKDEVSWVRKAAASKSILNKKEIDEILKTANQKFPAKSFKFKIKSSYGYGLVEDVGGEVGIDDVVEAILSGEEWDTFIRDEYYSYDSEWHEHGPTTLVDIVEYEDGAEEEIHIDGKYNHEHFGEIKIGGDALGKMEFFQIATSWEKGEWEYEEFELYDGFEPNFLKAIYQDECSTEELVQKYEYHNPESDKDNDIEIYGEFMESRTSGTDIDLYVNTRNEGLQYFDSLSEIVDEIEGKGLDAKNEKVVHEFLIEKYFKEKAD